jgi:hypothetical protein
VIRLRFAIAALIVLLPFSAALAQVAPDDLIITGAGWGRGWDTEIELSDSELGTGTSGAVSFQTATAGPCPPFCNVFQYSVPPKGTVRFLLSEAFPAFTGFLTLHVSTNTEQPLPVVRARVFNGSLAAQSGEIPVFRNPTLAPRRFPVLVFPGLRRGDGVYSNLILQNLDPSLPAEALVEAFDAEGHLIGSEVVTAPREPFGALVLVDVAGRFGASALEGGSVRVTNRSDPLVWGVLATLSKDGRIAVVAGANP